MTPQPRRRIALSLIVAYAVALVALLGLAGLTFLGFRAAREQIETAGQSLRQLETARIIEAGFNRYLLDLNRHPPGADGRDSPAAGNLRGTLLVHRGIVAEEIAAAATPAEEARERAEMVRALQLSTIFEDIERKTIYARAQLAGTGERLSAADMAVLVAPDEAAIRRILAQIIADEQAESAAALTRLEDLRKRYLTLGGWLAGLGLLVVLLVGVAAYRQLLRPIRALTRAVEGQGDADAASLPGPAGPESDGPADVARAAGDAPAAHAGGMTCGACAIDAGTATEVANRHGTATGDTHEASAGPATGATLGPGARPATGKAQATDATVKPDAHAPMPAAPIRAPSDLPGEFALLADRFNSMLDRIDSEQDRLRTQVEAATADQARANAELRRIDSARRAFFANISHELRTPITVLLGEAQVALKSDNGHRAALERISASGGFLRRRLDDLLALARSEDGTLQLDRVPFDLADEVTAAVAAARAFAEVNEVALDLLVNGDREVLGDASALRQAVLALIDNAVKFSPPGGRITVRLGADRLCVSDEGPGFGDTDPMDLFDRYVQGGSGKLRGGTGLGLAIVAWIADHHGARVEAENGRERGAVVRLIWT